MNSISKGSLSTSKFPEGFGKFPYIILKAGYAIYMQIPIQINPESDDLNKFPGTHLNDIDLFLIEAYRKDKTSVLHDILLEHTEAIKEKIEADTNRPARLCLVEAEDRAYYFDGDTVSFNSSIPSGGTLVTHTNSVIGIDVPHFLTGQNARLAISES